jgi:hypothetical protein
MEDDDLVHRIAIVTSSDVWWKPVIGFLVTNCAKFADLDFTNEEHDCFLSFVHFFIDLFDSFLAKRLNSKASTLESALLGSMHRGNRTAISICRMLKNFTDFVYFREQMLAMNEVIRQDTVKRVLACQQRSADANQAEATDLSRVLEEGEEAILEIETAKKCEEYREIFGVEDEAEVYGPRISKTPSFGPPAMTTVAPRGSAVKVAKGTIVKPTKAKSI